MRLSLAASALLLLAAALTPLSAKAQAIHDAAIGARLGPAYAQMVNLSNTPDLSTARYHIDTSPSRTHLDVTRVPLSGGKFEWSESTEIVTRLTAGYMRLSTEIPTAGLPGGRIDTSWTAVGLAGGVAARIGLPGGYTFVPGLDVGASHLENRTSYLGAANVLQPLFDGSLFNWRSHAWQVSPGVGLEWLSETLERRLEVRSHLGWSRVASFGESDPSLQFRRSVGALSIRVDRTSPASWTLFDFPPAWVLLAGHTVFLGPSRNVIGFTWVSELGGGLEWPARSAGSDSRIRATISALFGDNVRGLRAGLGLEF